MYRDTASHNVCISMRTLNKCVWAFRRKTVQNIVIVNFCCETSTQIPYEKIRNRKKKPKWKVKRFDVLHVTSLFIFCFWACGHFCEWWILFEKIKNWTTSMRLGKWSRSSRSTALLPRPIYLLLFMMMPSGGGGNRILIIWSSMDYIWLSIKLFRLKSIGTQRVWEYRDQRNTHLLNANGN